MALNRASPMHHYNSVGCDSDVYAGYNNNGAAYTTGSTGSNSAYGLKMAPPAPASAPCTHTRTPHTTHRIQQTAYNKPHTIGGKGHLVNVFSKMRDTAEQKREP